VKLSLRELRAIAGQTVRQVAERMGLQDEEVVDLEKIELRRLSVDELARYCDALGMPVTITALVHSRPTGQVEILSTRKRRTS